jgi:hypothetical protein
MSVRAEARVVGQVKAIVIGIFVEHDLVGIPVPVAHVAVIVFGDAEIIAAEPEPTRSATTQAKSVVRAKAAAEVTVFPRVVDVIVRIASPRAMTDPFAVVVDVRSVGVVGAVGELVVVLTMVVLRMVVLRMVVLRMIVLRMIVLRMVVLAMVVPMVVPRFRCVRRLWPVRWRTRRCGRMGGLGGFAAAGRDAATLSRERE